MTIRDFRDILVSNWRVINDISLEEIDSGRKPTDTEIKTQINRTIFYIEEFYKMVDYYENQATIIKYEDFYNDHNYLYDVLEKYLEINISIELRKNLSEKYSMKANKERADKFDSFRKWDESGIHGNHVHKGKVGVWRELIEKHHHTIVNNALKRHLERWGYEV